MKRFYFLHQYNMSSAHFNKLNFKVCVRIEVERGTLKIESSLPWLQQMLPRWSRGWCKIYEAVTLMSEIVQLFFLWKRIGAINCVQQCCDVGSPVQLPLVVIQLPVNVRKSFCVHFIDVHNPVHVVVFVLNHPCRPTRCQPLDGLAMFVESSNMDRLKPGNLCGVAV